MVVRAPARRDWWNIPIGTQEKVWLSIVFVLGIVMFVTMLVWHVVGAQNSPTETYRVSPEQYWQKVTAFNAGDGKLSAKTDAGIKPLGDDAYLGAMKFGWLPNPIVLEAGRTYRIHVSSKDVNHGFSIHENGDPSQKANFQVVPGYEHVLTMTFDRPGTYDIICQEYCGIGHQFMVGKFIVKGGS